ncbi:hypothetical protein CVT24_013285 [Panaeolus cyanescens]|uniref:TrmE-type G domain-containing protein n=1 Tax=Panaeolus cyanescens TaxID=181874 RepID=A0A409VW54_9AGAR|nr:hypothetical protein CVT24_013285 [Panaeolus cyanescens]
MIRSSKTESTLKEPIPWKLNRCRIVHPENQSLIDDGLAVYFKAPYSYTKLPTLELHVHSGRAIIASLLTSLSTIPLLRPAEPGEFTKQALLGGRLDLTQVEGLHDLIEADTEVQRIWALEGALGTTRSKYDDLRQKVIHCLAQVEALIDFGEGEEIEEAKIEATSLLEQLKEHLNDHRRGELVRSGIRMAIFGPPNAGKSSLFNYFANRDASIVTSIPGTTRDVLELTLDIGGLPIIVADTAGLRETEDIVESIGVERGMQTAKGADVKLCVLPLPDVLDPSSTPDKTIINIPEAVAPLLTQDSHILLNKSDLVPSINMTTVSIKNVPGLDLTGRVWAGSVSNGTGMAAFTESFSSSIKISLGIETGSGGADARIHAPLITRERHRVHLEAACRFLEAFLSYGPDDVVFAAEELRYAAQAIGRVTGDILADDILDAVFRDFCIGK